MSAVKKLSEINDQRLDPFATIAQALAMLATEIDMLNRRLDEHEDPDLVGPHYRGGDE